MRHNITTMKTTGTAMPTTIALSVESELSDDCTMITVTGVDGLPAPTAVTAWIYTYM